MTVAQCHNAVMVYSDVIMISWW